MTTSTRNSKISELSRDSSEKRGALLAASESDQRLRLEKKMRGKPAIQAQMVSFAEKKAISESLRDHLRKTAGQSGKREFGQFGVVDIKPDGSMVIDYSDLDRLRGLGLNSLADQFRHVAKVVDKERVERIFTAYIEASMPLQEGVRLQAELGGAKIVEALSHIPMYTAREIALKGNSSSEKPETLTAQWVSRKRIFSVELAGHGVRYPGFQFQLSGTPWPGLAAVLPQLVKNFDSLALVLWFDTPHASLDGLRPLDVVGNKEKLLRAVNETLAPIDVH